jgi:hypothetical protein
MSERGYIERGPFVVSAVALGGYRSVFSVPMLHEDKLIGVITIFSQEVRPFTGSADCTGRELCQASRHRHREYAVAQ